MKTIYTGTTIAFQHNNKFNQANKSHVQFDAIVEAVKAGDYDKAYNLIDLRKSVSEAISGTSVTLEGNVLMYNDMPVKGLLGERILQMWDEGFNIEPMVLFLENLMHNPSKRAVDELYGFMEVSQLPITEDGYFLAYKSVKDNYTDHHSGTFDNSVGSVCSMPRNGVDEDKDRTCSAGLHFAAHEYASGFYGSGKMVVLKINPKDVVAIPSDYNNQKGRCCHYLVVEEVERNDSSLVGKGFVHINAETPEVFVHESVEKEDEYEPQSDNYTDHNIWEHSWASTYGIFIGETKDFPINRETPYDLYRNSNNNEYRGWFFVSYDTKHDNLVFRKHTGTSFDYCTIAYLSDWEINVEFDEIVYGK